MTPTETIQMALDPGMILRAQGIEPDPWQRDLLLCQDQQILLNCTRQAGKSTTVATLALHTALFRPKSLILLLSPGQRQSTEIFRKILDGYNAVGRPLKADYETQLKMELANGSRIMCLPGKEETVRCFSPHLLVIDEASRVPDDLYRAVRPMLAVSKGRLIALSTPFGQRGWFWSEWHNTTKWKRVKITWRDCPRITADFIEEEKKAMGDAWVNQEYECEFTALEGLVYPDFHLTLTDFYTPEALGKKVGGIDWGWRNPFAAIWGVHDTEHDILYIQDERYLRQTSLDAHCKALPKGVMWYCDPSGPVEIDEFRVAGHTIRKGNNDIRLGVAAVTARIRTGRLKVNPTRCPNLCAEAKLYRYPSQAERALIGENPVDEHNHALGALRYLVSRLDSRFIAKLRGHQRAKEPIEPEQVEEEQMSFEERARAAHGVKIKPRDFNDPDLWTGINT